jgi:hypothetical protein
VEHSAGPPERAVDWVDLGEIGQIGQTGHAGQTAGAGSPEEVSGPSRGRRPSQALVIVAGLVLVALAAVALRDNRSGQPTATQPTPRPSSVAPGPATPTSDDAAPSGPAPVVTTFAPHLLGITAGWELFGRGDSGVMRLEPAAGRLSRTRVPPLQSTGPASLLVGDGVAVVRPLDDVPGYAIGDGEAARLLRADLSSGGIALPGPDLRHVWFDSGDERRTAMALVSLEGVPAGVRMVIPSTGLGPVMSDGDGYVMFSGIGGVYDVRPTGLNRVTTGTVAAVGARRLLAVECNDQYRCSTVVVGLTDGSRRLVPGTFPPTTYAVGSIAPDGRLAAVFELGPSGDNELQLFDLRSGRTTRVRIPLMQPLDAGVVAWSPDSALLFAVDTDGHVKVVDPVTGRVSTLGVAVPAVKQIVVRPAVASAG